MPPPGCDSEVPRGWALGLVDDLARYMVGGFHRQADPAGPNSIQPLAIPRIPLQTLCEADRLVGIIHRAYIRRLVLSQVDLIRVAEQVKHLDIQADESEAIDPETSSALQELTEPTLILDRSGHVVLWYLPNAVSPPNQSILWGKVEILKRPLRESIVSNTRNWRNATQFFRGGADLGGCINLSPAWFQQGRHAGNAEPEVSALLKDKAQGREGREWVGLTTEQLAILSGAMSIMHPDMFTTGREAIVRLGVWAEANDDHEMLEAIRNWPSVFSVASVMVNRSSPIHLDANGRPQWMDLLLSFGEYEELDMVLPTLGLRLRYNPGTAVAMSGQIIPHGVGSVAGNRGVIALYMRDNVHEMVDVARCGYMVFDKVPGNPSTRTTVQNM